MIEIVITRGTTKVDAPKKMKIASTWSRIVPINYFPLSLKDIEEYVKGILSGSNITTKKSALSDFVERIIGKNHALEKLDWFIHVEKNNQYIYRIEYYRDSYLFALFLQEPFTWTLEEIFKVQKKLSKMVFMVGIWKIF